MAAEEPITYEKAKKRLEQIMSQIDSGKIGIDDLNQVLAESRQLIETCMQKLSEAEKIVIQWEE